MKLSLGQQSIDEIKATEVPDIDFANSESLDHPLVLWVAVTIFIGPKSVGDPFDRIHDRAGKVVSRVDFPLLTEVVQQECFSYRLTRNTYPVR